MSSRIRSSWSEDEFESEFEGSQVELKTKKNRRHKWLQYPKAAFLEETLPSDEGSQHHDPGDNAVIPIYSYTILKEKG